MLSPLQLRAFCKNVENPPPKKKKYSPTNEVTHPTETPIYAYDMTFLCPPPPSPTKKYPIIYSFFSLVSFFFSTKKRPYYAIFKWSLFIFLQKKTYLLCYFQLVNFHLIFHSPFIIPFFFYHFALFFHFEIVKIMISF